MNNSPSMRTVRLIPMPTLPSLLDLWAHYRFPTRTLAELADVPESTVLAMYYKQPVSRSDAQKVLAQLSTLLHKVYTLATVDVRLIEEGHDG